MMLLEIPALIAQALYGLLDRAFGGPRFNLKCALIAGLMGAMIVWLMLPAMHVAFTDTFRHSVIGPNMERTYNEQFLDVLDVVALMLGFAVSAVATHVILSNLRSNPYEVYQ